MTDARANDGFGGNGGGAFFDPGDTPSGCGFALGRRITLLSSSSDSGLESYSSADKRKLPLFGRRRLSKGVAIPKGGRQLSNQREDTAGDRKVTQ